MEPTGKGQQMTDQPTGPTFTPAQAAEAVGQVQNTGQGTDAGAANEEMIAQAVRAAMSDFEKQLADVMARSQAAFTQQQDTIDSLSRQLVTVRAQAGPPVAGLLADSLATRVQSIADANPDLGGIHFAGVISQARALADEVKAVAAGQGDAAYADQVAHGILHWFERVHPRASGKFLEGMHAAMDEAERLIEELPNLLPVAGAIVKAL